MTTENKDNGALPMPEGNDKAEKATAQSKGDDKAIAEVEEVEITEDDMRVHREVLKTLDHKGGKVNINSFSDSSSFAHAQRVAMMLAKSDLVPEAYRGEGKIANVMVALEMSTRIGASPLQVMQNLYIVHGKPSWSSQFIISSINSCGKFSPLRYQVDGEGETLCCYAWALDKETGDRLEGPEVTMAMAHAEGWLQKKGSKWQTMPGLMIRYRAAAFFGRLYAPEIMMGMHTIEEVNDIQSSNRFARDNKVKQTQELKSMYTQNKGGGNV